MSTEPEVHPHGSDPRDNPYAQFRRLACLLDEDPPPPPALWLLIGIMQMFRDHTLWTDELIQQEQGATRREGGAE